ncbi:MAG: hypothetical protein LBM19_03660 [Holosporales bacterium]|jgi:hypothetical protein|nr:hypothetical protein [Holosporales bacterium]
MIREIDYEKILRLLKKHYLPLVIILLLFVVDYALCLHKNKKLVEFENVKGKLAFAEDLLKTPHKLKFISSHLFSGDNVDFDEFVVKTANDNFAEITSIEKAEETDINSIKKSEASIKGIFWHESFIFDFLKNIQEFKPGFLKITSVAIGKFGKVSPNKPAMKIEVACEIYQK